MEMKRIASADGCLSIFSDPNAIDIVYWKGKQIKLIRLSSDRVSDYYFRCERQRYRIYSIFWFLCKLMVLFKMAWLLYEYFKLPFATSYRAKPLDKSKKWKFHRREQIMLPFDCIIKNVVDCCEHNHQTNA